MAMKTPKYYKNSKLEWSAVTHEMDEDYIRVYDKAGYPSNTLLWLSDAIRTGWEEVFLGVMDYYAYGFTYINGKDIISDVKRRSDGEVFKVGDKVLVPFEGMGNVEMTIEEFSSHFGDIDVLFEDPQYATPLRELKYMHPAPPNETPTQKKTKERHSGKKSSFILQDEAGCRINHDAPSWASKYHFPWLRSLPPQRNTTTEADFWFYAKQRWQSCPEGETDSTVRADIWAAMVEIGNFLFKAPPQTKRTFDSTETAELMAELENRVDELQAEKAENWIKGYEDAFEAVVDMAEHFPNDQELGKAIRRIYKA